jgi:hypothetical protein
VHRDAVGAVRFHVVPRLGEKRDIERRRRRRNARNDPSGIKT